MLPSERNSNQASPTLRPVVDGSVALGIIVFLPSAVVYTSCIACSTSSGAGDQSVALLPFASLKSEKYHSSEVPSSRKCKISRVELLLDVKVCFILTGKFPTM